MPLLFPLELEVKDKDADEDDDEEEPAGGPGFTLSERSSTTPRGSSHRNRFIGPTSVRTRILCVGCARWYYYLWAELM